MYPGYNLVGAVYILTNKVFYLGWAPISSAMAEPEEQCVFYCIILTVFWGVLSLALFLFVIAGFKVAQTVSGLAKAILPHGKTVAQDDDQAAS